MRTIIYLFILIPTICPATIIINEIMISPFYNSANGETYSSNEYVELYNNSSQSIDLKNWLITDIVVDDNDKLLEYQGSYKLGATGTVISPLGFALIVPSSYKGRYNNKISNNANPKNFIMLTLPDTRFLKYGLNDTQGTIHLYTPDLNIISSYSWSKNPGRGVSWQRIGSDDNSEWIQHFSEGTPGYQNSLQTTPKQNKRIAVVNKIFSPLGNSSGFYTITIKLSTNEKVELSIFSIYGKKIREITVNEYNNQNISIYWDGRTEQGAIAPTGLYIIQIRILSITTNEEMFTAKKCCVSVVK